MVDLQGWKLPNDTVERLLTDNCYERFVDASKFKAKGVSSQTDSSFEIPAATLINGNSMIAKRVKITGQLDPAEARKVDLQLLFPIVTEMSLEFLPRRLPPFLKRLNLRITNPLLNANGLRNLFP
jgi:hypothetical protein